MQDQFNLASLAKLSKTALLSLIATYAMQLDAAFDQVERSEIRGKILAAQEALRLKLYL